MELVEGALPWLTWTDQDDIAVVNLEWLMMEACLSQIIGMN